MNQAADTVVTINTPSATDAFSRLMCWWKAPRMDDVRGSPVIAIPISRKGTMRLAFELFIAIWKPMLVLISLLIVKVAIGDYLRQRSKLSQRNYHDRLLKKWTWPPMTKAEIDELTKERWQD